MPQAQKCLTKNLNVTNSQCERRIEMTIKNMRQGHKTSKLKYFIMFRIHFRILCYYYYLLYYRVPCLSIHHSYIYLTK